jgi:hypothetical protein
LILLILRFHCWFYHFTVDSETVKSTNVRSKINLCTKSLIIRTKILSVTFQYSSNVHILKIIIVFRRKAQTSSGHAYQNKYFISVYIFFLSILNRKITMFLWLSKRYLCFLSFLKYTKPANLWYQLTCFIFSNNNNNREKVLAYFFSFLTSISDPIPNVIHFLQNIILTAY